MSLVVFKKVQMDSRYLHLCSVSNLVPNPGLRECFARGTRTQLVILDPSVGPTHGVALLTDDDLVPIGVMIQENLNKSFRLRFCGQRITDRGASMLASLLQVHEKILSFSLPSNQIKDEGASAFGASLASCMQPPQLIDLSGNCISDTGAALLFKGCSLRTTGSLTLLMNNNHTSPASTVALTEAVLTAPLVLARVSIDHVSDQLRAAAVEVGLTLMSELAVAEERLGRVEAACAFPTTQESKLKKLTFRVSELEKQVADSAERETAAAARVAALEEQVVKEQELCAKLLKQCSKVLNL